jgi:FdhD protein
MSVPYSTAVAEVRRVPGGESRDLVAVEEPLELRIGGEPVAVTMRTPGHDEELALGFALGEGLGPVSASLPNDLAGNAVELTVREFDPERLRRHFYTSSSCGVCGKGALAAVAVSAPRSRSELTVDPDLLASLPDRLRKRQAAFELTGGLHAAGLFDPDGRMLVLREDVGRHNAVDKVSGARILGGHSPADAYLVVSGRAGFELVQKAVAAGAGSLVAVGAPSSLAVHLAREAGLGLFGFTREERTVRYA